jgi:hypothetical protein
MKTILEYKQELETVLKTNAQGYPVLIADGYNVSNNLTAQTIASCLATTGICISICPAVQETDFKKVGTRSLAKLTLDILIETNPKVLPDFCLCEFANSLIKLINNIPEQSADYDWEVQSYVEVEESPSNGMITVTRWVVL